jgi:hypothetical protein
MKRFTTTSHYDPTITSKVRTALMEDGHYDLVAEQLVDAMRDIESMSRSGLTDHDKRIKILEDGERDRLTQTSVTRLIDAKLTASAVGWGKWAIRGVIAGIGTALLAGFYQLCALAWKGLHQ